MEHVNEHKQQLDLISEMISSARKDFSDNSFLFLLWGWAVALASLLEFTLIKMNKGDNGLAWLIFIPLALVCQVIFMIRRKKKEKVRSHLDRIMAYLWIAIGACLFVVLSSGNKLQLSTYPFLILLYGIGTFISGGIMRLKAMQIGGVFCWVIAAATIYAPFEYQLLLLSLALIVSYIIPGHILQNRFKRNV